LSLSFTSDVISDRIVYVDLVGPLTNISSHHSNFIAIWGTLPEPGVKMAVMPSARRLKTV
jgi:hypothetical protein